VTRLVSIPAGVYAAAGFAALRTCYRTHLLPYPGGWMAGRLRSIRAAAPTGRCTLRCCSAHASGDAAALSGGTCVFTLA